MATLIKYDKDNPTEVLDRSWVSWGNRSEATIWEGKWVILLDSQVDSSWHKVTEAIEEAILGPAAKVASASWVKSRKYPGHPLLAYTEDYRDREDLLRVLRGLRQVGFMQEAFYKEDLATLADIYGEGERLYYAPKGSTDFKQLREPVALASIEDPLIQAGEQKLAAILAQDQYTTDKHHSST